jgi:hypothetical protein
VEAVTRNKIYLFFLASIDIFGLEEVGKAEAEGFSLAGRRIAKSATGKASNSCTPRVSS